MKNIRKEIDELAQIGDSASVSLIRDLVTEHNPFEGEYAMAKLAEIGSEEAGDAIFSMMRAYPEQFGKEGMTQLGEIGTPDAFSHIYNFVSAIEMGDQIRLRHMLHAMEVCDQDDDPSAELVTSTLMRQESDVTDVYIQIMEMRAREGDDEAVESLGRVAMFVDGHDEAVMNALLDLPNENAPIVFEEVQGYIADRGIYPAPNMGA